MIPASLAWIHGLMPRHGRIPRQGLMPRHGSKARNCGFKGLATGAACLTVDVDCADTGIATSGIAEPAIPAKRKDRKRMVSLAT